MTEMLQKHADLKVELIRKCKLKTALMITLVLSTKRIISNKLQECSNTVKSPTCAVYYHAKSSSSYYMLCS